MLHIIIFQGNTKTNSTNIIFNLIYSHQWKIIMIRFEFGSQQNAFGDGFIFIKKSKLNEGVEQKTAATRLLG